MSESVRVTGLRELEAELEKLATPATRKASARRALVKSAGPLAELMRSLAPERTGNLANSITVATKNPGGDAGKAAFAAAMRGGGNRQQATAALRDARRETASQVWVYVGPGRHPQAITQEFGTSFHGPQPYARPAWDQDQASILERIKTEIWTDIEKSVARAARRAARAKG